jgi:hypothetical protein
MKYDIRLLHHHLLCLQIHLHLLLLLNNLHQMHLVIKPRFPIYVPETALSTATIHWPYLILLR